MEFDTHLCIICNSTIYGLDNYVNHRTQNCSVSKRPDIHTGYATSSTAILDNTSEQRNVDVSLGSIEQQFKAWTNTYTPENNDLITFDATPQTRKESTALNQSSFNSTSEYDKIDISSEIYTNTILEGFTNQAECYSTGKKANTLSDKRVIEQLHSTDSRDLAPSIAYDEKDLNINDFLSSLELQMRPNTASKYPPSSFPTDSYTKGDAKYKHNNLEHANAVKIAKILSDMVFSSDSEDDTNDFVKFDDILSSDDHLDLMTSNATSETTIEKRPIEGNRMRPSATVSKLSGSTMKPSKWQKKRRTGGKVWKHVVEHSRVFAEQEEKRRAEMKKELCQKKEVTENLQNDVAPVESNADERKLVKPNIKKVSL